MVVTNKSMAANAHSTRPDWSSSSVGSVSSTMQLANIVITAAENSEKSNRRAADIAQLRVSDMNLHGRDDEIKLLRSKLRELEKKDDVEDAAQNNDGSHDDEFNPNVILVSGTSGTGKSSLIRKGLGDPAAKRGFAVASGKFDAKLRKPLSAFSDAMTSLAKHIMVENKEKGGLSSSRGLSIASLIRDKIRDEFDEEDVEQLHRVLPGCATLLGAVAQRPSVHSQSSDAGAESMTRLSFTGKASISQLHYAIRRLLKIICSNLKGVVLFIDDLQWSDTATLDLLQSIVLDGEIPSLLIVGAYRDDEVPE